MDIEYKLFREDDYKDLEKMIFSLYDEDPEGEKINEHKIKKTVDEYKNKPEKIRIYMFKNGDENIGYSLLVFSWSNEYGGNILTIDELYVAEKYRGKGAATKFLNYIKTIDGIAALQLETTPSNQRVLEYYKRLGFISSQNTHLIKTIGNL